MCGHNWLIQKNRPYDKVSMNYKIKIRNNHIATESKKKKEGLHKSEYVRGPQIKNAKKC